MGCWNGTCGLSNLPIHCGTKVIVVPTIQSNSISDFCYTDAVFSPFPLHVVAEYDDYGGIENETTGAGAEVISSYVKQHHSETSPDRTKKYHADNVADSDYNIAAIINATSGMRELHIDQQTYTEEGMKLLPRPLSFVMFREDVIEELKATVKFTNWRNRERGPYTFIELLECVPALVDHLFEPNDTQLRLNVLRDQAIEDGNDSLVHDIDDITDNLRPFLFSDTSLMKNCAGNLAAEWLCVGERWSGFFHPMIRVEVEKTIKAQDKAKAIEIINNHLIVRFIDNVLSLTRRIWSPGSGVGSQSSEVDAHIAVCEATTSVAKILLSE